MITRAEHGGAQSHVLGLMTALSDQFRVQLAVGEEGFLVDACRNLSIPVHILPALRREIHPIRDLLALVEALRVIKKVQPDLIHAHTSKAGIVGRLAGRLCGIPAVYTAHSWGFNSDAPLRWRIITPPFEKLASKWTSRIITVSHYARDAALRFRIAEELKLTTIHNGVPDVPLRADPAATSIPLIAMVARFSQGKDHDTMIKAFAELGGTARLMLIGDGPTRRSMEELVDGLGLRGRVEFLGDRDDVPELLAQSSVFVLSSKFENMPISILEAMRAGLPVIATAVGGVREAVIDGETGLTVQVGSVADLAKALTMIILEPERRIRMGQASRARFLELFSEATMLERTIQVYREALQPASRI
jgi:glycosyltransferase involved in cell wall biosynthesis